MLYYKCKEKEDKHMTLYIFERGEALARKLSKAEIRMHEKEFGKLIRTIKNYC
jgi:hypothetical protein